MKLNCINHTIIDVVGYPACHFERKSNISKIRESGKMSVIVKFNNYGVKELYIGRDTSVEELRNAINHCQGERSIWVIQEGLFSPDVYEFLAKNKFEIYIHNKQSRARFAVELDVHLPPFPSFIVGAGGVVYDEKTRSILMIKEKKGPVKSWKFPGGYVNHNENPIDGAIREVCEETGISTIPANNTPLVIIYTNKGDDTLKTSHGDIYMVYLLYNTSNTISIDEIGECKWIPIDEYYKWENLSYIQRQIRSALQLLIPPP